ncbi:acetylglutamate kinase [Bhargavaea ginsengi]|nr:acetylglutamate kinase [Bhargavaea ginsengi]
MMPVPMAGTGNLVTAEAAGLKADMRLLWEQHIAWTRMTIISLVFDLPDTEFTVTRLLRNAEDMGNAIEPYYGELAGERYAALIREHLTIAADLVKAAKAGETEKAEQIERDWYRNADEIVEFLSSANPYISKAELQSMFYEHLALTKIEAVCMIIENFELEVEVYDRIESAALEMSDMISDAIIRQFGL